MLYREIIAVCSQIHTKHINTLCGQNVELLKAPTMLPAGGRQHRGCIISQIVTHSLVLLKMGKIISRNMLS